MTDSPDPADEFVGSGGSIDFGGISERVASSFVLVTFAGVIGIIVSAQEALWSLWDSSFAWVSDLIGMLFTAPAESLGVGWRVAGAAFPIAGPLDWMLGVLLVVGFFMFISEVITRLRRVS